jgi:hypothetical protein
VHEASPIQCEHGRVLFFSVAALFHSFDNGGKHCHCADSKILWWRTRGLNGLMVGRGKKVCLTPFVLPQLQGRSVEGNIIWKIPTMYRLPPQDSAFWTPFYQVLLSSRYFAVNSEKKRVFWSELLVRALKEFTFRVPRGLWAGETIWMLRHRSAKAGLRPRHRFEMVPCLSTARS